MIRHAAVEKGRVVMLVILLRVVRTVTALSAVGEVLPAQLLLSRRWV